MSGNYNEKPLTEADKASLDKMFKDETTKTADMRDCIGCGGVTFNPAPQLCDKCKGITRDALLSDNEKKANRKYSRNRPCPCGSRRNFKNCHARYELLGDGSILFLDGRDVTDKWERVVGEKLITFYNLMTPECLKFNKESLKLWAANYDGRNT